MSSSNQTVSDIRFQAQRAAVEAVLTSQAFRGSPRLGKLFGYICDKHFSGELDSLKEFNIATDVFGRPAEFDQGRDAIVRVEIHRLRKKLLEYYRSEGAAQPVTISIPVGKYQPEFLQKDGMAEPRPEAPLPVEIVSGGSRIRFSVLVVGGLLLLAVIAVMVIRTPHTDRVAAQPVEAADSAGLKTAPVAASTTLGEIRIQPGNLGNFRDRAGNVWGPDRFFSGGSIVSLPLQYLYRTRDASLFLKGRMGSFTYAIPLADRPYELGLYFAETTYSPASTIGGGENSRVFDVSLNGSPLLRQFDIVADASANTADVQVFKGVRPAGDGLLHLQFTPTLGMALLNGISLTPGGAARMQPIRMVTQDNFYTAQDGAVWGPDTYVSGGQIASHKAMVTGTRDPGLYQSERYGNFSYALPVDSRSTYTVRLHFAETYWGTASAPQGGIGSRLFDVFCNGAALLREVDIFREAGANRALVKTFHRLRPNAQRKLNLSFVPVVNYAVVEAIEVLDETPEP